ncbi:MAG TPA: DUF6687 family protein [Acidimicrobiales bacterium]|nr:DUF6687 family protein [Acidimicrobiales bacterium]
MSAGVARPLPFVAAHALDSVPHIVVDGGARPSTVLALTHWPGSSTPPDLARDLSAEIAFAYLRSPAHWRADALAVTNDHLDQDGLVSIHALRDPAHALAHERLLVEVARVGDFAVARDDDALAIALAIRALAEAGRSDPGGGAVSGGAGTGPDRLGERVAELLRLLPGLVESPDRARALCAEELAAVESGRRALEAGEVSADAPDAAGVATVVVDERLAPVRASRFCEGTDAALHPVVVHQATGAARVLVARGRRYRYYDRYETWVRYASGRPPLRRALAPLAERLSEEERGDARWRADDPGALEPSLEVADGGESSIPLARLRELVGSYLLDAPVAWDPYASGGGVAGEDVTRRAAPTAGTTGRGRLRSRGPRRGRPST